VDCAKSMADRCLRADRAKAVPRRCGLRRAGRAGIMKRV
jgi:hypothetical protein